MNCHYIISIQLFLLTVTNSLCPNWRCISHKNNALIKCLKNVCQTWTSALTEMSRIWTSRLIDKNRKTLNRMVAKHHRSTASKSTTESNQHLFEPSFTKTINHRFTAIRSPLVSEPSAQISITWYKKHKIWAQEHRTKKNGLVFIQFHPRGSEKAKGSFNTKCFLLAVIHDALFIWVIFTSCAYQIIQNMCWYLKNGLELQKHLWLH